MRILRIRVEVACQVARGELKLELMPSTYEMFISLRGSAAATCSGRLDSPPQEAFNLTRRVACRSQHNPRASSWRKMSQRQLGTGVGK